jgi:CheY-like chemotaxis protein
MHEEQIDILLVEDDPNDAEITRRAIRAHHPTCRILVIEDGQEALDFLFGEGRYADRNLAVAPKVILLDLKLPKVDGHEVLRRLKRAQDTRLIPVVMLTSSGERRDVEESYRLGVNSYIVKPIDLEELIEAMRIVGEYWLSQNQLAWAVGLA